MRDAIADSAIVEFIRDLFSGDVDAAAMFRWMLVGWLVASLVMIGLDRFGSMLLGKSRPLVQRPPDRARTWRWRRHRPPQTYALTPSGTMLNAPAPRRPASIPLAASSPVPIPEPEDADRVIAWNLPAEDIPDSHYWETMAFADAPILGPENHDRLVLGRPPERYNPVTGDIEELIRDGQQLRWPFDVEPSISVDLRSAPEEPS